MKIKLLLLFWHIVLSSSLVACAQSKQDVMDFIERLPTIDYGVLPYWHDKDLGGTFVHGFTYGESDSINVLYKQLITKSLCDSSYVIIDGDKIPIKIGDIDFCNKNNKTKALYNHPDSVNNFKANFTPVICATAKSIVKEKYFVVYFWLAQTTQDVYYFTLVFDCNGHILSYHHFDCWMLGFANFPFFSHANIERHGDYPKAMVTYLPNRLILSKEPNTLIYGGYHELSYLNDNGHYETVKSFEDVGSLEENPPSNSGYINYIRWLPDEDGNAVEHIVEIPFVVHDMDGYANIRMEANGNAKVIRTINDGDMVWGNYLPNGWCQIAFTADSNGKIVEGGYIHSSRLEKISDPQNDEFIKLPSREEWETFLKRSK